MVELCQLKHQRSSLIDMNNQALNFPLRCGAWHELLQVHSCPASPALELVQLTVTPEDGPSSSVMLI